MNPVTEERWSFIEGTDVVGADGQKVGEIVAIHPHYIVVEKGFFFPTDYYVPTSAVATYDGDKVSLNVTKDQALQQGWETQPAAETDDTTMTRIAATAAPLGATPLLRDADRGPVAV